VRLAVDTNVLIRLLVDDNKAQADAAEAALQQADQIVISLPVLCEVAWVLRQSFRFNRQRIAEALRDLVSSLAAEVDAAAFEAGIAMLEKGGDFADGMINQLAAQARCDGVLTFDQNFARIGGRVPVTLLSA
jgi:predicted nucleic-acid-binding protein